MAARPSTGLVGRALWTFAGQSFSSASNFLLTVLVLGEATEQEFATFSIAITTYLLIVQLSRAVVSVPVLVLYSTTPADQPTDDYRRASGLTLLTGLAASVGLVAAAVATEPLLVGAGEQFLLLAAAMPLLLQQDNARHVAFAQGRPAVAALSDASWIVVQAAGWLGLSLAGEASTVSLMAVWAAAGALAWGVAAVPTGAWPRVSGAWPWLQANRQLCRRLVLEFVATSGSYYVLYYGLAVVAGADELGRLKAALTFYGPVIVLLLGGLTLGVPETVRARGDSRHLRRLSMVISASLGAACLAIGALVYATLPGFGPRFFPNAWSEARPLIPLLSLYAAALGISTGALSALRALGASAWIVRARAWVGALLVVVGLSAAWVWGATGALLGLAVSESTMAAASWLEFRRWLEGP